MSPSCASALHCLSAQGCLQDISVDQRPLQVLQQFNGLSTQDTVRLNKLPIEPPNPCVCAGGGYVIEVTNHVRCTVLLVSPDDVLLDTCSLLGQWGSYVHIFSLLLQQSQC